MYRRSLKALLGLLCLHLSACIGGPPPPVFQETACQLSGLTAEQAARMTCGTVSVPRNYRHREGGTFELAVVVIRATGGPTAHDPVLYVQGGPGFPLIDHADYMVHQIFAPGRDLILVDQRGMGRSTPVLCPHGTHDQLTVFAQGPPLDKLIEGFKTVYARCREELLRDGIEPDDFGTLVTVEDLELVRQALGIRQWNVYGVSYGTTVAMTLEALYPHTVRAAVLDSAYPPEPLPMTRKESLERSLRGLYGLCAADRACAATYPHLDLLYAETERHLAGAPLIIRVPESLGMPGNRVVLGAAEFEIVMFLALYERTTLPHLPRLMTAAHDGRGEDLEPLVAGLLQWFRQQNMGAALAIQCRDRPVMGEAASPEANILDLLAGSGAACAGWPAASAAPKMPVGTRIPTLVLSGAVDPVTPSAFGRLTANEIGGAAQWIEFPGVAHGVQHSTLCGALVVWRFFRNPNRKPDTSCLGTTPSLSFVDEPPPPKP
jgi:pimeloyl-ACP methyl ester carboxylesterase